LADFYLDNDVALEAAELLRDAGHTAVTVRDLGREGDADDEHLLIASQQGRIFVTHNEGDFVLLHDAWQRWSAAWEAAAHHAGVLIVPQGARYGLDWTPAAVAQAILDCLQQCSPAANQLYRRKEAGWQRRVGRDWVPCG